MIRKAKFGDIPAIYGMLKEAHERSKYRDVCGVDERYTKALLVQGIQRHGLMGCSGTLVMVSEHEGKVEAFIYGFLDRVYTIGDKLMASDTFFLASPGARPRAASRLFNAYIEWAASNENVVVIGAGATDVLGDYHRVEKMLVRKGFARSGVIYERNAR